LTNGVTLRTEDRATLWGDVWNYGTLISVGITVNEAAIHNWGNLINRGWLHPHNIIENGSVFENEGLLDVCSGLVLNRAYFHNTDSVETWGGMENEGFFVNDGYIHNPDLNFVGIINRGTVENNEHVDNEGIIYCTCGAAWYGDGTLWGNSIQHESCDPVCAIQRLRAQVIKLGPQASGVLSKQQVIPLVRCMDRAGKWLLNGHSVRAGLVLEDFTYEVDRLVFDEELAFYIGLNFVARAGVLIDSLAD